MAREDNAIALMGNPQGKNVVLQATWFEWKGYRFHIEAYGTKGMLRAYYAPMMTLAIYMEEPGGKPHRKYNFYPMNIVREKMHGWRSTTIQEFRQEFDDFVGLCEGRKGIIADAFSGFRAVEIADTVYRKGAEK